MLEVLELWSPAILSKAIKSNRLNCYMIHPLYSILNQLIYLQKSWSASSKMLPFLLSLLAVTHFYDVTSSAASYSICSPVFEFCEYWLVLEERLTMVHEADLVYGHQGYLYKYHEHWTNATSTVSPDEVITTDGHQRMVLAVNNSVPGPPIVLYEGQTVWNCFYF